MNPIIYYITAHGYGHGVRSCAIVNALTEHSPGTPITLVTSLPDGLIRSRLTGGRVEIRPDSFDVGLVQVDSMKSDLQATGEALHVLSADWGGLVEQESEYLGRREASAVVCDIPGIPLMAARALGIPAIAAGNFGWDFIYREIEGRTSDWDDYAGLFERAYGKADLLIRLPFAEPMSAFPNRIDVPVVTEPGENRKGEILEHTGLDPHKRLGLLSFASLEWDEAATARLTSAEDWHFLAVEPLRISAPGVATLSRTDFPFADLVASVDAVITKPGFGIVSECAANQTPMVYAERLDFPEYPYLVEGIERYLRAAKITIEQLYHGDVAGALNELERAAAPPITCVTGGAAKAARLILDHATG